MLFNGETKNTAIYDSNVSMYLFLSIPIFHLMLMFIVKVSNADYSKLNSFNILSVPKNIILHIIPNERR